VIAATQCTLPEKIAGETGKFPTQKSLKFQKHRKCGLFKHFDVHAMQLIVCWLDRNEIHHQSESIVQLTLEKFR
jgi:hypothetical protein